MTPRPSPPPLTSPLREAMLRVEPINPTLSAPLDDPQMNMSYWNHRCPCSCGTWVPNHRVRCTG